MRKDIVDFYQSEALRFARKAWNPKDHDFDFGFSEDELSRLIELVRDEARSYVEPDCWIVIRIESPQGNVAHKLLIGTTGNLFVPDSWKLTSVVESVEDCYDYYIVHTDTRQMYKCAKNKEYTSFTMQDVLEAFIENNKKGDPVVIAQRIPLKKAGL